MENENARLFLSDRSQRVGFNVQCRQRTNRKDIIHCTMFRRKTPVANIENLPKEMSLLTFEKRKFVGFWEGKGEVVVQVCSPKAKETEMGAALFR